MNTGQAQNLTPEQQAVIARIRDALVLLPADISRVPADLIPAMYREQHRLLAEVAAVFPEGGQS